MRHVLLSVVGNTPQVVTETLYAMHKQEKPWPEQFQIVTTTVGRKGALRLLDEGILAAMCDELGKPCPHFGIDDILVVPDAEGGAVADARTVEDHEALADYIMMTVRDLTADDGLAVHASLAGGRKTMTFYLGYAMSLFGRLQDSLSHVLVSPEFENVGGFFYPSSRQGIFAVKRRDDSEFTLDSTAARVELADIPFIRHRGSLPGILAQAGRPVNFRTLVGLINLGEQPEQIRLSIDCGPRTVRASNADGSLYKDVQPNLLEFAFYLMMARSTLEADKDMTRPEVNKNDKGLAKSYCDELLFLCGIPPCQTLDHSLKALENWSPLDGQGELNARTLENLKKGIVRSWFDQRLNILKSQFREVLPNSVVEHLLPRIIWDEDGERLTGKTSKGGGYGIGLPLEHITLQP
ncbi:MAG: CRISPR-associated ring nuclease Csm6 [Zoogloea oleivorans]|jgi:CRISPR-associated protein (TIGR02584 family)|uniref:CRISPR-associated ring nuclease Csm6 n=1 Tax=Zoogloea oleivorans TaxID=1552750 RepID=UPI002A35A4B2|nr:CRISPR-associated ring nuclease Csm6 [Zoogloea oleivorans]MDY0038422.1 CRISPR-associated ring nuclease Csm6 [Zoogloea oleivorans]